MSTTRQIMLTEEGDWWVAEDQETGVASQGETRTAALENLDDAMAGTTNDDSATSKEKPPAAPLYDLIGLVDDEEGKHLRERSRVFREEFDNRIERTREELSNRE